MSTRATPALTTALEYLEGLRRDSARTGQRLPTVVQLAKKAGVSPRAMHHAVRACAQAGILSVRHRAGTCWADPSVAVSVPSRPAGPQAHAPRASRLADEMEQAVLSGTLPDPLPPAKVLRARYRTGHAVVRHALEALAARGSLVRRGRRWVVARCESRPGAGRIMLVAPSTDLATYATFGSKAADFCSTLERQCSINATALQFQSSFRPLVLDPSLIGYIVIASPLPAQFAAVVARLSTSGRPVVVVDLDGETAMPRLSVTRQTAIVRAQGSRSSARQVALHLRELGHRRIAFLSPFGPEQTRWVADRFAGLRDVYGDDAVAFWLPGGLDTGRIWQLVLGSLMQTLSPATDSLAAAARTHGGITDPSWVGVDLPEILVGRYGESRAQPLFEQAAEDHTLTAWVGANDDCARWALRYLARKRINVPGAVSVVGFDGSRAGLYEHLSSFDFNIPALVDAALRLVLGSEPRFRTGDPLQIDIPGTFVVRGTVARI